MNERDRVAELQKASQRSRQQRVADARQRIVERHFTATEPKSWESFVGLEHFRHTGTQAGVEGNGATFAFKAMVNPNVCRDPLSKTYSSREVDPSVLGLVVCERVLLNFPECPREVVNPRLFESRGASNIIQISGLIANIEEIVQLDLEGISDIGMNALMRIVTHYENQLPASASTGQ